MLEIQQDQLQLSIFDIPGVTHIPESNWLKCQVASNRGIFIVGKNKIVKVPSSNKSVWYYKGA